MPMRDYRCGTCDSAFEALSHSRTLTTTPCTSCGAEAKPVLSTFGLKVWAVDRSNFALIAPLDEHGKPRTLVETQRSSDVDAYRPGERSRMLSHEAEINKHQVEVNMERAKREAWREVRAKTRTVIRG